MHKLIYDREFRVLIVAVLTPEQTTMLKKERKGFMNFRGDMTLKVAHDGQFYDVPLSAGDTFCLPARVPHIHHNVPQTPLVSLWKDSAHQESLMMRCSGTVRMRSVGGFYIEKSSFVVVLRKTCHRL